MIEDVINSIRRNFRTNGCPARVEIGPQFVAEHAAPPRVVFVPIKGGDSFEPPLDTQPRAGATLGQPYENPRQIRTRWAGVEAHIWAAGIKQTEPGLQYQADRAALGELFNQTYAALYEAAFGAYRDVSGGEESGTKLIGYGLLYIYRFQLAIPVLQIPYTGNAPFGANAALGTGNTWTNLPDVKPKITESFDPTGNPKVVIEP
jgi:hypothetical protein